MPRINDLIDGLGRGHIISQLWTSLKVTGKYLSLLKIDPKRLLSQFKVMPFGLQGAPATFQRLMDRVIASLSDFTATYLDDVIIFSETWEKHLELTVKAKKSQFGAKYCTYTSDI